MSKEVTLEAVAAVVDSWFQDELAGGPIGRQTEAYNQAHHAREKLQARLKALFQAGEGDPADVKTQEQE